VPAPASARARAATAALAACAVLGSGIVSGARAAAPVALDGSRRHHATYGASVTTMMVGSTSEVGSATFLEPSKDDCTKASCDITRLHLTLPRGSTVGRFTVAVNVPRELYASAKLYDVRGRELQSVDALSSDSFPLNCCATTDTGYTLQFTIPRLSAGDYTFVVFDQGGGGSFTVGVDYTARRPERRTHRSG
jgi:hypothetical protein